MPLPLISFFLSLVGIIVMIWREIVLVRNGKVEEAQHLHPFVPDLEKIKYLTSEGSRKLSYVALFVIIKLFIKTSNFVKTNSLALVKTIKSKVFKKNQIDEIEGKKEVSKYLKIIGEYRHKIRQIKHRIKKEEGIE